VGRNANNIVRILGGNRSTILDGVTLTGAKSNRSSSRDSALSIFRGSPTIRNCRFVGNNLDESGSINIGESPEVIIANCLFVDNEGAAIFVDRASPLIVNCTFSRNEVDEDG